MHLFALSFLFNFLLPHLSPSSFLSSPFLSTLSFFLYFSSSPVLFSFPLTEPFSSFIYFNFKLSSLFSGFAHLAFPFFILFFLCRPSFYSHFSHSTHTVFPSFFLTTLPPPFPSFPSLSHISNFLFSSYVLIPRVPWAPSSLTSI